MTIIVVLIAIITILFALSFATVVLETEFSDNAFCYSLKIAGFRIMPAKKNSEKRNKRESKAPDNPEIVKFIKEMYHEIIDDIYDITGRMKNKIVCREFLTELVFSCGDAAVTGETCGLLWSIVGLILPALDTGIKFRENPVINITPHFGKPDFDFHYKGIYEIKICHIIYIGINVIKKIKKYKGGVKNG